MSAAGAVAPARPAIARRRLRTWDRLVCVDDFRTAARRRLPRAIFDFVDGGAGHGSGVRANEAAFGRYRFRPRVLTDVSKLDLATTVLGQRVKLPVLFAPSGMQRLVTREGELATVRAAERVGTVYVLSISASTPLEEVAAAAPAATRWFQVYLWDTHDWVRGMLDRARHAGFSALCVTVDSKAPGGRKYRDMRNGLTAVPPRINPRATLDAVAHPRWLAGFLRGRRIRGAHLPDAGSRGVSLFRSPAVIQRRMDPSATWEEVRWLRSVWDGPLLVKGILNGADAGLAFSHGADAVICSNHGGRLLDGVIPSLDALPEVAEVAARRGKEVLFDSGVRTGAGVVKALALGARACLVGRPFWWGLAVGGEAGAVQVLDILTRELQSTMTQPGRASIAELDGSVLDAGPLAGGD